MSPLASNAPEPGAAAPLGGLTVLLDDRLATVTRALGVLRRRRVPVASFTVGSAFAGTVQLTVMLAGDRSAAERAAAYLRKIVGVRAVTVFDPGAATAAASLFPTHPNRCIP